MRKFKVEQLKGRIKHLDNVEIICKHYSGDIIKISTSSKTVEECGEICEYNHINFSTWWIEFCNDKGIVYRLLPEYDNRTTIIVNGKEYLMREFTYFDY